MNHKVRRNHVKYNESRGIISFRHKHTLAEDVWVITTKQLQACCNPILQSEPITTTVTWVTGHDQSSNEFRKEQNVLLSIAPHISLSWFRWIENESLIILRFYMLTLSFFQQMCCEFVVDLSCDCNILVWHFSLHGEKKSDASLCLQC